MMTSSPARYGALDLHRLRHVAGSDPVFMRELVVLFVETSTLKLDEACRAIACGNLAAVWRCAHGLLGSSANIGATAIAGLAERLEERAREADLPASRELVAKLTSEIELLAAHLEPTLDDANGVGS